MNIVSFKTLNSLGFILALSACAAPGPLTQDRQGRAVVTSAQGAAAFQKLCFNPGGKTPAVIRAVKKDANYTSNSKPDDPIFSAEHKTQSINLLIPSDSSCMVTFVTAKPSAEGAAQAAALLMKPIKAKGINGKKGGGAIGLRTANGMVVIGNMQRTTQNGVMISFSRR